jgi:hypothetical protein
MVGLSEKSGWLKNVIAWLIFGANTLIILIVGFIQDLFVWIK